MLTFLDGGLVNQSVHWFMSGCLTLKFSGSWKTVISSLSLYSFFGAPPFGATFSSPAGEMGMVSRGTWVSGLIDPLVWTFSVAMIAGE